MSFFCSVMLTTSSGSGYLLIPATRSRLKISSTQLGDTTMNEEQRIYLASPYSSPEQPVRDYRHRLARQFTHLKRGRVIFSPIVNGVALAETGSRLWGFVYWQDYDLSFIQHWATELWVLCLDGWKESEGVQKEIRVAKELGLPIKYMGVISERFEN